MHELTCPTRADHAGDWRRECEARKRGDDHVVSVGHKRLEQLLEFEIRTGPSVEKQDRWFRPVPSPMKEMDPLTLNLRRKIRQLIQATLDTAPVEYASKQNFDLVTKFKDLPTRMGS